MQCGRPGKILALLTTPQPPSVPSSGRPSATTSRRWTRTQPSGCAGAIPRSWSSTPPASSCGPTPPPRASTPPTHTPSSSGCTGCSSWPSTTRLMVRLHRHRFEYIWEVMEGLKSWIFIFPVCVSLLSQGTFLYLHPSTSRFISQQSGPWEQWPQSPGALCQCTRSPDNPEVPGQQHFHFYIYFVAEGWFFFFSQFMWWLSLSDNFKHKKTMNYFSLGSAALDAGLMLIDPNIFGIFAILSCVPSHLQWSILH